jgi:hypothetical protein
MTIHTSTSLRTAHRRLARRVGRLEKAELVLAEMQRGSALHLSFSRSGPQWALSNGRPVSDEVAKLVTASASVVGVGDALFDGIASQTWRWWREPGASSPRRE